MSGSGPETERRALELLEQRLDADTPFSERTFAARLAQEPAQVRIRYAQLSAVTSTVGLDIQTRSGPATQQKPPPASVGPFQLVSRIGVGGMGQVWLAQRQDGYFDQQVAIKLIHEDRFTRNALRRFDAERRILARLEHPGIARLIDGGVTADGQPWLAMEYVDGLPLDRHVRDNSPDLRERIRLVCDVCAVVQAAHARLVIHADLKPGNILVDQAGHIRLLDFGIARMLDDEAGPEAEPLPLTPAYSSPARLAGRIPTVADDVYALGLILRDLRRGDGDADLAAIETRACSPDDATGYGSAQALDTDLQRWLARLPVQARPASRLHSARLFVRRHRVGASLSMVALAALLAISTIATVSYFRAENARQIADHRFDQVHHMARFMMFGLYDQLSDSPGTVRARRDIAALSGQYLERLRQDPDAPLSLRIETVRGYNRLAAIQGLSGTANLGQVEQAHQSLATAETLARGLVKAFPDSSQAHEELGWALGNKWVINNDQKDADRFLDGALQAHQQALALDGANTGARMGLLSTRKNIAFDLIWADKPQQARTVLEAALRDLDATRWPADQVEESQLLKVQILNRLGDSFYYADDLPASLKVYARAEALTRQWLSRKPGSLSWNHRGGESAWNLGAVMAETGDPQGGLAVLQRGIAGLEQIMTYGPDANIEKMLIILLGQKADTLLDLKRFDQALVPARRNVEVRRSRLASEPGDTTRQRDLAVSLESLVTTLAAAGLRPEACAISREAVQRWDDLQKRNIASAIDRRRSIPQARSLRDQHCKTADS